MGHEITKIWRINIWLKWSRTKLCEMILIASDDCVNVISWIQSSIARRKKILYQQMRIRAIHRNDNDNINNIRMTATDPGNKHTCMWEFMVLYADLQRLLLHQLENIIFASHLWTRCNKIRWSDSNVCVCMRYFSLILVVEFIINISFNSCSICHTHLYINMNHFSFSTYIWMELKTNKLLKDVWNSIKSTELTERTWEQQTFDHSFVRESCVSHLAHINIWFKYIWDV